MNDAIDRKDTIGAISSIEHIAELSDGDGVIRVSAVNYVLRNLPSADVAEVVRCKDCRNWACTDDHRTRGYCLTWHRDRGSKDYCSEGRKKDGSDLKAVDETTDELYKQAVDAMKNYSKSEMPYNVVTFDVAPISDVQPVRHGHWIYHTSEVFPADSTVECSVCHEHESILLAHDNYCPNCGVKMDGEEDE